MIIITIYGRSCDICTSSEKSPPKRVKSRKKVERGVLGEEIRKRGSEDWEVSAKNGEVTLTQFQWRNDVYRDNKSVHIRMIKNTLYNFVKYKMFVLFLKTTTTILPQGEIVDPTSYHHVSVQ